MAVTSAVGAIVVGLALGAMAALALQGPARVEPGLANLLHAMVGIKALLLTGALALLMLRLRGTVGVRSLAGYCLGLGMSAAALAWLWGLSGLLIGSALFYGGLGITYLTATRDPLLGTGFKS